MIKARLNQRNEKIIKKQFNKEEKSKILVF